MVRIAVVGHRDLGTEATIRFVTEQCLAILQQVQTEHGQVVALSALADGADTIFAEAALRLGIPLDIVRPFDEFATDFTLVPVRSRYEALRAAARHETRLAFKKRSDEAYEAAMRWVVDHSDILIAAWDGRPAAGLGGTGDAVRYGLSIGRKFIHLNILDLVVTSQTGRPSR